MKGKTFKILLIFVVSLSVLVLGGYVVSAQIKATYPPIVQKLSERFNLNPDDVNKVFEEQHQDMHQQHSARLEERLNAAVKDAKITEEQKTAILKKFDELKTKMEEVRDLPADERRQALTNLKEELTKWAKDNNIDVSLLGCGPGMFGPGDHMGGKMGRGMHGDGTGGHMGGGSMGEMM